VRAAQRLATRISAACRSLRVATAAGDVSCTCSIGISELRADDFTIDDVMRRADVALYEAKRGGRNCWKAAAEDPAEAAGIKN
jgi:diguanylate cyclase (GGDEF)-like protein